MKKFEDSLGREFKVGDIVVHASLSWKTIKTRIGIVTGFTESSIQYIRLRSDYEGQKWVYNPMKNSGEYIMVKGPVKSIIKCPLRSVIIGNVLTSEQPAMPEELASAAFQLKLDMGHET